MTEKEELTKKIIDRTNELLEDKPHYDDRLDCAIQAIAEAIVDNQYTPGPMDGD